MASRQQKADNKSSKFDPKMYLFETTNNSVLSLKYKVTTCKVSSFWNNSNRF